MSEKQERPPVSDRQIEKPVSASKPAELPVASHNIDFEDNEKVEVDRLVNQSNDNSGVVEPSVENPDVLHSFSTVTAAEAEASPVDEYAAGAAARQRAILYLKTTDPKEIVQNVQWLDLGIVESLQDAEQEQIAGDYSFDSLGITWEAIEESFDQRAINSLLKYVRDNNY